MKLLYLLQECVEKFLACVYLSHINTDDQTKEQIQNGIYRFSHKNAIEEAEGENGYKSKMGFIIFHTLAATVPSGSGSVETGWARLGWLCWGWGERPFAFLSSKITRPIGCGLGFERLGG